MNTPPRTGVTGDKDDPAYIENSTNLCDVMNLLLQLGYGQNVLRLYDFDPNPSS